jgi:hypothetical protein
MSKTLVDRGQSGGRLAAERLGYAEFRWHAAVRAAVMRCIMRTGSKERSMLRPSPRNARFAPRRLRGGSFTARPRANPYTGHGHRTTAAAIGHLVVSGQRRRL